MHRKKLLYILSLVCTVLFCVELTIMGIIKFNSVLVNNFETYNEAFPDPVTRLRVMVSYLGMTIAYVLYLFQPPEKNTLSFSKILKYTGIFLILAFLAFPRSTDIYLYLQYGWMALNGVSPYLNSADSFASHLSPFLHWSQTATYGPISLLIFMIAAAGSKLSPLVGIYVFKLFCLLVHGLNSYLIWCLINQSKYRTRVTIAYLINPLLLSEHLVSAHVDVFIASTIILLGICLLRCSYIFAVSTLWLGFFIKTIPILWFPLLLNFLVYKKRWKDLVISITLSGTIVLFATALILPTSIAWKSLINPGVAGQTAISFHYVLNALLLILPLGFQAKQSILSLLTSLTYLGFAIFYGLLLIKPYLKRSYSEANLFVDIGWMTLVLFLFATPWFMPWYPSILLAIAALNLNAPFFVLVSLTFSLSSNLLYGGAGSGISLFSVFSTLTVILPPIIVLLLGSKHFRAHQDNNMVKS